ncbi:MAG TPA: hypothetical protein VLL97_04885 [Acidobacteriota bacterium]|nr:hypothetical protein [Acidobacteriota bacterium]
MKANTVVFSILTLGAALIVFSMGLSVDRSEAAASPGMKVVYSSNVLGYFEPCG